MKSPWYHLGVDFIGSIAYKSPAGNRYIQTIMGYCMKWAAVATPEKSEYQIANSLFKLFMKMGIPCVIATDQGSEFNNHLNQQLMSVLTID